MTSETTLRPLAHDLLSAVCALHNRSYEFDGLPRMLDVDELGEEFDDEHFTLDTDTRVATVDQALAGYAYTVHLPSDVGLERAYIFGSVDPEFRGRGVGRALLAWGVQRADEQLRSSGSELPKYIRVEAYDHISSAQHLFARLGFIAVRYFEELLRPLDTVPAPSAIPGISVEPWPLDRDDELRRIRNTAFADHWGSTPMSPDRFEHRVHGFGSRLDLSFVAVDDASGRMVAECFNTRYPDDDELLGRRDGWIDDLGTLPEWRGRGIASALIGASLRAFAADGLTHASIGVDSDSPTGAARLYRALGFEPQLRSITWQLRVG